MTTIAPAGTTSRPRTRRSVRSTTGLAPYAFIAPFYVLYGLFLIVPVLAAIYLSLTEWVGLGTPDFVGLRNYTSLAMDTSFHTALGNSLLYVLVSVLHRRPGRPADRPGPQHPRAARPGPVPGRVLRAHGALAHRHRPGLQPDAWTRTSGCSTPR